jgi:hypothetical protein
MLRFPSIAARLLALSLVPGCSAPANSAAADTERTELATPSRATPDAHQILWQRDLDQALALARAEDRPLFVAVNMDGESASDRIVCENYRDPRFVADTRPFVCLVASVFRHNPRDHDEAGRRIPCPRLGECTCGEHMALEPALFERFLQDGERVAPRHAVILVDGTKAWDLSLCFDLHDIDRELAASARTERERRGTRAAELPAEVPELDWEALAARRDARGRAALELRLLRAPDEASLTRALEAIAAHGDAGSAEALRLVAARLGEHASALRERFLASARALGLERVVALQLRDRLRQLDPLPGGADPVAAELLPLLATLDGAEPSLRSMLLACGMLDGYGASAGEALARVLPPAEQAALEARVDKLGGPFALRELLAAARGVTRGAREPLPRAGTARDAMPEAAALEQTLAELEPLLARQPDDPELRARFAKASLDLGRRRLEEHRRDVQDLFGDAAAGFDRALAARPAATEWWIERARAAYFLARFADEAEYGRRALALAAELPFGELPDERNLTAEVVAGAHWITDDTPFEALRWIGDGDARLLAERSGTDAALEGAGMLEGLRALGFVAASPFGNAQDWLSFASFAGALGLWREEFAIVRAGVERLPAAPELRSYLNNALWNGGQFELAPFLADELAGEHSELADAWWFAGQAWLLAGENARRLEQPERALADYARSRVRFERAAALRPEYGESCRFQIVRGWLGRGFAAARAGRRAAAAECLVEAVATGAQLPGVADGLGYDVLDLVDKICEWRETGPSPVDPLALAARLAELAPDDPFWPVALSDSELREALRADGRNPVRAMRDTVDAEGKPIRMLLGLPDEEGDACLLAALALARRALPTSEEDRKVIAQADTIWAERMLERGRLDGVAEALAEAAPLCALAPPAPGADLPALRAKAAELRALLGEARPRWRLGR